MTLFSKLNVSPSNIKFDYDPDVEIFYTNPKYDDEDSEDDEDTTKWCDLMNNVLEEIEGSANNFSDIVGRESEYNSAKIKEVFNGKDNDFSVAICLNAAAGLIVIGKHTNFKDSYNEARNYILSGKTYNYLNSLQNA